LENSEKKKQKSYSQQLDRFFKLKTNVKIPAEINQPGFFFTPKIMTLKN